MSRFRSVAARAQRSLGRADPALPDRGKLEVRGRVASLLSVDAGLLALLTGRENALLLGVIAGLPRRTVGAGARDGKRAQRVGRCVRTAGLDLLARDEGQAGIRCRRGNRPADPAAGRVHEALDHEFRNFLQERAEAIVKAGGIVVAAGHDHPMRARLCTRAIWMEGGAVRADGPFEEVQPQYLEAVEGGNA
jgi:hypothetical protein